MALARLLVHCSRMLQHGSISPCWLAASAAQGHKQWQQFACMQHVAPAASPSAGRPAAQPCSRLRNQAKAVPQHISPSATAAAGLVRTAGFQLPGLAPGVHSRHQQHKHTRGLCSTPLQDESGQQQPQAMGDTSPALSGPHDWQRKRPADMNSFERLVFLHERVLEEFGWDLEELTSCNLQGPSTTFRSTCPECNNGSRNEDCFAVTVQADEKDVQVPARPASVVWCCHRANCGFTGGVSLHTKLITGASQQQQQQQPEGPWQRAQHQQQQLLQAQVQQLQQQNQPQLQLQAQPGQQPARQQPSVTASLASRPSSGQLLQLPQTQAPGAAPQQRQLGQGFKELTPELLQWLNGRGISKATLDRNRVQMEQRYCGALKAWADHMAFPYYKDGVVVNVKYRALPKQFTQVKGGEQIFFGYDDAQGAEEIIIVEGELDKLAVEEALMQVEQARMQAAASSSSSTGEPAAAQQPDPAAFMTSPEGARRAVISVPAGAPSRAATTPHSLERKFKFVDDCRRLLTAAKRVVLAVDTDGPGLALAAELARRVGPEKCLTVRWPRKDANEVLLEDGAQALKACLDAAEAVPIRGLFHFDAFRKEVWLLYTQGVQGLGMGCTTGWKSVDKHYKVVPGELTIVTGLSNSGKSEWLDALTVNLAQQYGWRIAVCSLENTPVEHGRKLMEKYCDKAFFSAADAHDVGKMGYNDVLDGISWIDEHFHLILPPPDEMPSIDYILEKARAAVLRYGVKGLVIDPYNELDTRRRGDMFETEYVSCMLSKVKRFAQAFECHVWFVAHPRTQRGFGIGGGSSTLSAPSMYDISGSAHFINKADNGIVIHRPHSSAASLSEGKDGRLTQILVRKVRNKVAGSIGDITLLYNKATGRYEDLVHIS